MSSDNFIAVLQTSDGFRIAECAAFENFVNEDGSYKKSFLYDVFAGSIFTNEKDTANDIVADIEGATYHTEYGTIIIDAFVGIPFTDLNNAD